MFKCFTAYVLNVVDGDTLDVRMVLLDLGVRKLDAVERIRLSDIDCPERYTEEGRKVKDIVTKMALGKEVTVIVDKLDKYGRILGHIFIHDEEDDDVSINLSEWLVENGYAEPYL